MLIMVTVALYTAEHEVEALIHHYLLLMSPKQGENDRLMLSTLHAYFLFKGRT